MTTMTATMKSMLSGHLNKLLFDTKTKVFSSVVDALVTYHAETAA